MFVFPRKLYPLTDARISGLSHAEQVTQLIQGGAALIQLREKHLGPREFYREAELAVRLAHDSNAQIIINDRADIALALAADGVHLGQDDLPPEAARRWLGPHAVIGLSTHNLTQAQHAATLPIDYIAIGPIFATRTKDKPEPVVGLEGLRQVRDVIGAIPLVAIGGITPDSARTVLAAGADAIALIGALLSPPPNIERRTRELLALL